MTKHEIRVEAIDKAMEWASDAAYYGARAIDCMQFTFNEDGAACYTRIAFRAAKRAAEWKRIAINGDYL
jgi:hypothetical protein